MSSIIFSLDDEDLKRISERVIDAIKKQLHPVLKQIQPHHDGPGVEILDPPAAAELLDYSRRHLRRLENSGKIPRRRRISPGRVGYLRHELEGKPAAEVLTRSRRVLNRAALAEKLGLNPRTLGRILDQLPPPNAEGEWYERDIDEWILRTPPA